MEEIHYDILETIDNTRGTSVKKPVIERLDYDPEDIKDALNYLTKNKLVKENNSLDVNAYRVLPGGVEALYIKELRDSVNTLDDSIHSLDDSINVLHEQQKDLYTHQQKSSSVETIFTFALITFAYLQLAEPNLDPNVPEMILGLGIGWALLVGGLTPFRMTGKRFKQIRNRLV